MSLRAAASVDSSPLAGVLALTLVPQGWRATGFLLALVVSCHATRFGSWDGKRVVSCRPQSLISSTAGRCPAKARRGGHVRLGGLD